MPPSAERFAVYASASGSYYYTEIRRLLAAGLRELGARVVEADGRRGFVGGARWHVVVAAHEFFDGGSGSRLRRGAWPDGVILYDGEPLESRLSAFARRLLPVRSWRCTSTWRAPACGRRLRGRGSQGLE